MTINPDILYTTPDSFTKTLINTDKNANIYPPYVTNINTDIRCTVYNKLFQLFQYINNNNTRKHLVKTVIFS